MSEKTKRRETGEPHYRPDFVDDSRCHPAPRLGLPGARGEGPALALPHPHHRHARARTGARACAPWCFARSIRSRAGTCAFTPTYAASRARKSPRIRALALHVYDARGKFQLRMEGRAQVLAEGEIAEAAWEGSRMMSRACYATRPAPGTQMDAPDGFFLPESDAEIDAGRENFSAVIVTVERVETLYLDHAGHRRAAFDLAAQDTGDLAHS